MKVIVCKDYKDVSKKATKLVMKEIITKPNLNLGLATGSSPIGLYKNLIEAYRKDLVSFSEVRSFNLDEYIGIERNHPQSYYSFMFEHLFKHVDIKLENINIPNNNLNHIESLAEEYNEILDNNIIDVQILGIGSNGHIGFNEPGTPLSNKTFIVNLDEQTRLDNARFFNSTDEVPDKAITMGIKNIMRSKKIILLASGDNKKDAIYKTIYGEITNKLPASILQLHPDCTLIVDEEAGSLIKEEDKKM